MRGGVGVDFVLLRRLPTGALRGATPLGQLELIVCAECGFRGVQRGGGGDGAPALRTKWMRPPHGADEVKRRRLRSWT